MVNKTKWLNHWSQDIMAAILQTTFQINVINWKSFILIQITLKFIRKGPIKNKSALVQIMSCDRTGDKPLSKSMMALPHLLM